MIPENYEENGRQPEPTPNELESSRRPQMNPQLPAILQDCVMFNESKDIQSSEHKEDEEMAQEEDLMIFQGGSDLTIDQ